MERKRKKKRTILVIKKKLLNIVGQQSFLRKIQAHCDILESTNTSCSSYGIASCGKKKKIHVLFFVFFLNACRTLFCSRKEGQNTNIYIYVYKTILTCQTIHTLNKMLFHFGLNAQHTQQEASMIKSFSWSWRAEELVSAAELPHWYHSVQFCRCNNIICPWPF